MVQLIEILVDILSTAAWPKWAKGLWKRLNKLRITSNNWWYKVTLDDSNIFMSVSWYCFKKLRNRIVASRPFPLSIGVVSNFITWPSILTSGNIWFHHVTFCTALWVCKVSSRDLPYCPMWEQVYQVTFYALHPQRTTWSLLSVLVSKYIVATQRPERLSWSSLMYLNYHPAEILSTVAQAQCMQVLVDCNIRVLGNVRPLYRQ